MTGHTCPHPIDDYGPGGADTWTCPDCRRVWQAHTDIWWAPAEDSRGGPVFATTTDRDAPPDQEPLTAWTQNVCADGHPRAAEWAGGPELCIRGHRVDCGLGLWQR